MTAYSRKKIWGSERILKIELNHMERVFSMHFHRFYVQIFFAIHVFLSNSSYLEGKRFTIKNNATQFKRIRYTLCVPARARNKICETYIRYAKVRMSFIIMTISGYVFEHIFILMWNFCHFLICAVLPFFMQHIFSHIFHYSRCNYYNIFICLFHD